MVSHCAIGESMRRRSSGTGRRDWVTATVAPGTEVGELHIPGVGEVPGAAKLELGACAVAGERRDAVDPAPIGTGGDADREALSRGGGRPGAGEDGDGGAQRIGHLDTTERERTMR